MSDFESLLGDYLPGTASPAKNAGPKPWSADPQKTALLNIDLQRVYADPKARWWVDLERNDADFRRRAEKLGVKIIHVALLEKAQSKPLPNGVEPLKDLPKPLQALLRDDPKYGFVYPVAPSALILIKNDFSAATVPGLETFLEKSGINTLLVAGVMENPPKDENIENSCVSATAKDFCGAKFEVVIPSTGTNCLYDPLALRRGLHAQWGVKILEPDVIFDGLKAGARTASINQRSSGAAPQQTAIP